MRRWLLVLLALTGCATKAPLLEVAITVDDLPRHGEDVPGMSRLEIHQRMLSAFAKHRVPPVYGFMNAGAVEKDPESRAALAAWVAAGHPLANHTYSHAALSEVGIDAYLADIDRGEGLLRELMAGRGEPWQIFRYPYLVEGQSATEKARIRQHLLARGYRIAPVTVDFYDWAYNDPYARCRAKGDEKAIGALTQSYLKSAETLLRWNDAAARELYGRRIKQILLLHAGAFDAIMIDQLLTAYEGAGVRFIPLGEALTDEAYAENLPGMGGTFFTQVIKARGETSPVHPHHPDDLLDVMCR